MWTLTTTDHLKYAVAPTALTMQFLDDQQGLCDLIGTPPSKHVILQVYTAAASEQVTAYECADGKVKVVRGDMPKPWPADACVRVVQIVDGPLCSVDEPTDGQCCAPAWDALSVCSAFDLDTTNPLAPSLCLRPTGVTPGDYCGLVIDVHGRVVSIDENFPVSCLPVFDPCACGAPGGGGGSGPAPVTAAEVSYEGQIGACVAVGPTVQQALEQVDSALCVVQGQQAASVVAGGGIVVTSVGSVYTVALQPIGAPGTYGGVTVNQYGQVTAVNIPGPVPVSVIGSAPVSVLQTGAASFTVSVGLASYTDYGVVRLAPPPGGTPPGPDDVVSWSTLGLWWANTQNYVCSLASTGEVDPAGLPNLSLSVCNNGSSERMTARDAMRSLGGTVSYYSNQGGSVSLLNILAVGPWTFQIPDAPARYSVVVEPAQDVLGNPLIPTVNKTGPQFTLSWFDLSGASVSAGPPEATVLVFRV